MCGAGNRVTCWEWEHGKRSPSTEQLITMAMLFGVPFSVLVPEAAEPEPAGEDDEPVEAAG